MRRFSRRTSFRRPRPHTQWARTNLKNVTGAFTTANVDLLAQWRAANNLFINLPDIVIWRIHIKISIHYTLSPATVTSGNSMFIASFVDAPAAAAGITALTNPYDEGYLIWDQLYQTDTMANGSNAELENLTLFGKYDVRSRRKLINQNDSLFFQMVPQGNVTMTSTDSYSLLASVLVKLPGRG